MKGTKILKRLQISCDSISYIGNYLYCIKGCDECITLLCYEDEEIKTIYVNPEVRNYDFLYNKKFLVCKNEESLIIIYRTKNKFKCKEYIIHNETNNLSKK